MQTCTELYVDGRWCLPSGNRTITVHEAATGAPIGCLPAADEKDVDTAMSAARRAFPEWSATSVRDRAAVLREIADGLAAREGQLAELVAREVGTPLAVSVRVQVGLAVQVFRSMADLVEQLPAVERIGTSLVLRKAAGVVAAITPWNYPLYQLAAKVAPALAAGCTTVVKPSSVAPLSTVELAHIVDGCSVPPGVFNLLPGSGSVVGELLAGHPETDLVSLTGSTAAGARVAEIAAAGITRTALELGGKSAFLLVEGADLEVAVPAAVRGCFVNNGQTCAATTRLLVPRNLLREVEERVAALVGGYRVGDPLDPATDIGPLASRAQLESVSGYLETGAREGTTLVSGPGPVPGADRGYFVRPTAFSRLDPDATVVREEIFGPVLSLVAYDGIDEGLRLADDSEYGLSGAVYAESVEAAVRVASRLRTGQVMVNGGRFNALAPFGGFRKSGIGRELGPHGLAEYFELTSLQLPHEADLEAAGAAVGGVDDASVAT